MTETAALANRPMLIALSHLRWDFVFQRPQHLLTRAARHFRVIYIEEAVRIGTDKPHVTVLNRGDNIEIIQPHVPETYTADAARDYQRAVVDAYAIQAPEPPILWFYTPMALSFARHVEARAIVFDKMDELSAFKGAPPALVALEQELIDLADVVFTGGASMYEAAAHRHSNIHCFPSSIDVTHFAAARGQDLADPKDQRNLPGPRIGFFGVIDERFDATLLAEVAKAKPEWQFVVIGPVVKIDPVTLPQGHNIHWLGAKQYADLPAYLAHWQVGWMPFAINESTRFISPTKTPEFLAAGLPVVSTAIRDVVRPYGEAGLVRIAHDADETVAAIDALLAGPSGDWAAKVAAQLAQGSWDSTWAAMLARIDAVVAPAHTLTSPKELAHV